MKCYLKRNIHHPVIQVEGALVKWEKFNFAQGILQTEDPKVIEVLDKIAAESSAVKVLTEDEYKALVEAQKKTAQSKENRRSFPVQRPAVDAGRSARSGRKSETPSPESQVPVAAPAAPKDRTRPVISTPVIQPPPGVGTSLEEPEIQ